MPTNTKPNAQEVLIHKEIRTTKREARLLMTGFFKSALDPIEARELRERIIALMDKYVDLNNDLASEQVIRSGYGR